MRSHKTVAGAIVLASTLALAGCGGTTEPADPALEGGVDDGSTLTIWARSATEGATRLLVDAYNDTHENQVELTVVPVENYLQKVGTAAGGGQLPDLLASDTSYAPNFVRQGIWSDLSGFLDDADYRDDLAPGPVELGTDGDSVYALPHVVALSVIFQNDEILKQAGIDPTEEIDSLHTLTENAATVAEAVPDSNGLYYAGAFGASTAFTLIPAIWASGGDVLADGGTVATLDTPEVADVMQAFGDSIRDGGTPATVLDEAGATRNQIFTNGNTGYLLGSSTSLGSFDEAGIEVSVQAIPGLEGGRSTFVGGDVVGISSTSDKVAQAWDFINWTFSEEAQVEVLAKNQYLTTRTDFAENSYAQEDPRVLLLNALVPEGRSAYALNWGPAFSDINGPWTQIGRAALASTDPAQVLDEGNAEVTAALQG